MLCAFAECENGTILVAKPLDFGAKTLTWDQWAKGKMRDKIPQLEKALHGHFGVHQRFIVAQQLTHIDFLDESIERVSQEIEERLRPFDHVIAQLDAITGIGRRAAEIILAEIGTDMNQFPSAAHLASWAGLCPGNNESAGKRKSGRTRKANPYLRSILVEAAQAAGHSKNTYLGAQYHRLAARRGAKKAAVAVAHSIIVIIYHMLTDGTIYQDLGPAYFDLRDRQALQRRLVRRLEALGNKVTLEPLAVAS